MQEKEGMKLVLKVLLPSQLCHQQLLYCLNHYEGPLEPLILPPGMDTLISELVLKNPLSQYCLLLPYPHLTQVMKHDHGKQAIQDEHDALQHNNT